MNKFKVGDPVKIRKGITNEDMGTSCPRLDLDKVYHISAVEGTSYHLKETHPGYCFCTDWLEPAPVTPPVDEPKEKAKAKYKVGDLVVFDMDAYIKDVGTKSSWADDVPTTPMTVTAINGHTHQVAETKYVFHDKWLRPAKFEFREKGIGIKNVIFSGPATIVFFTDGSKEVVKCDPKDTFDPEKGIALACARKLMGGDGYYAVIREMAKKESVPTTDQMRFEMAAFCRDHECFVNCPIGKHTSDTRKKCGRGYWFTTGYGDSSYMDDDSIRLHYKWFKEGQKDA